MIDEIINDVHINVSEYDPQQQLYMNETCILVDEQDRIVGNASKKMCHLNTNIKCGMLHRAFSVFLFNQEGKLLLQQRAATKITFPLMFTNTCCSHPLATPQEMDLEVIIPADECNTESRINNNWNRGRGVKQAAIRKLAHELGIHDISVDDLTLVAIIKYSAQSDDKWGEHEIDYVLVGKKNVSICLNENEVKSYRYVCMDELKEMLNNKSEYTFTPWFLLVAASPHSFTQLLDKCVENTNSNGKTNENTSLLDEWWDSVVKKGDFNKRKWNLEIVKF